MCFRIGKFGGRDSTFFISSVPNVHICFAALISLNVPAVIPHHRHSAAPRKLGDAQPREEKDRLTTRVAQIKKLRHGIA